MPFHEPFGGAFSVFDGFPEPFVRFLHVLILHKQQDRELELRTGEILFRRLAKPDAGQRPVLFHAVSVSVAFRKQCLRLGIAIFRRLAQAVDRLAEPFYRFRFPRCPAIFFQTAEAEGALRFRIALFGGLADPLDRLRVERFLIDRP